MPNERWKGFPSLGANHDSAGDERFHPVVPYEKMCPVLAIITSALTGGLAGAIISHLFTVRRDVANRKRTFRGYIRSVKAELLAIDLTKKDHGLVERHQATVSGVREACCAVSDDITNPDFEKAWVVYCGLTEADIAQREGETNKQLLIDNPILAFAPHYDRGRAKMMGLLEMLITCAN